MLGRLAGVALAGLLTVACAGGSGDEGRASLWVTRDRGARVVLLRTVAAGQTALQALEREAEVETRYGGRFVQSINGIGGSLAARTDWFWFVNGIEGDRSAAEYRLHPGDVEWWDLRSWAGRAREPVVVGAFPEPFLHGYDGRRRQAAVRYANEALAGGARAIARVIRADSVASVSTPAPRDAHLFLVVAGRPRLVARPRFEGFRAGDPVAFTFAGDGRRLASEPGLLRRRYRWP
ncbi:MAG: DUF4430 domain-containing protein [Actinomycetota bacterium]|nr:DUF4430 domain-containing protein [Actinomycetota bacterium]